jgi:hypothetical protein
MIEAISAKASPDISVYADSVDNYYSLLFFLNYLFDFEGLLPLFASDYYLNNTSVDCLYYITLLHN